MLVLVDVDLFSNVIPFPQPAEPAQPRLPGFSFAKARAGESPLSTDQANALELLGNGDNVFVTGAAGSGKSFLIQRFLRAMAASSEALPVLASTGAAAILVGGRTFHSFFGLGIMQGGHQATVERAVKNKRLVRRLKKAHGVIIDEISMISGQTLKAAEEIARLARDPNASWGGLRIIAVGDFAQLPPVSAYGNSGSRKDWAFLDGTWANSRFQPAVLRTIFRTTEVDFLRILNFVRSGIFNESVARFLREKTSTAAPNSPNSEAAQATRLFPHRETTERFNLERLAEVPGKLEKFETIYTGEPRYVDDLKRAAPVPEILQLKEGALVMIRQNDPQGRWVNGSLGHVARIHSEFLQIELLSGIQAEIEQVSFSILDAEGKEVAAARNFPVNLAYATTIHKAQGMTLDRVIVDLRNLWEPGQAYVALSRAKSAEGLTVSGWTPSSIKTDPRVSEFNRALGCE